MKLETILNAALATYYSVEWPANLWEDNELPANNVPSNLLKRRRQYRAFRARILRMDAEKDEEIAAGDARYFRRSGECKGLRELLAARDARIAELEITLKWGIITVSTFKERIAELEAANESYWFDRTKARKELR